MNLFHPDPLPPEGTERCETLLERPGLRVERIVSNRHYGSPGVRTSSSSCCAATAPWNLSGAPSSRPALPQSSQRRLPPCSDGRRFPHSRPSGPPPRRRVLCSPSPRGSRSSCPPTCGTGCARRASTAPPSFSASSSKHGDKDFPERNLPITSSPCRAAARRLGVRFLTGAVLIPLLLLMLFSRGAAIRGPLGLSPAVLLSALCAGSLLWGMYYLLFPSRSRLAKSIRSALPAAAGELLGRGAVRPGRRRSPLPRRGALLLAARR